MPLGSTIRSATGLVRLVRWRELACRPFACPLCGDGQIAVRLAADEMMVRCLRCRASAVTMSLVAVLARVAPNLASSAVYELSARGPLVAYLKQHAASLTCSEYFDSVAPGVFVNGVQCQDVQRLTYADASFDVCTSTEVFEHVPDDLRGFAEVCRVLRPKGIFTFTVPLTNADRTVDRVRVTADGEHEHLLPPEYHGDPLRHGPVLAFRNYGRDITSRLSDAGFVRTEIVRPGADVPWGYARAVVVAYK